MSTAITSIIIYILLLLATIQSFDLKNDVSS